jgi:hypothetical protein
VPYRCTGRTQSASRSAGTAFNITAEKCETVIVKNNFLKDKQDPASAVNRRVQIINLGR